MSLVTIFWIFVAGIWLCLIAAAGYTYFGLRLCWRKARAYRRLMRWRAARAEVLATQRATEALLDADTDYRVSMGAKSAWRRGWITDGDQ